MIHRFFKIEYTRRHYFVRGVNSAHGAMYILFLKFCYYQNFTSQLWKNKLVGTMPGGRGLSLWPVLDPLTLYNLALRRKEITLLGIISRKREDQSVEKVHHIFVLWKNNAFSPHCFDMCLYFVYTSVSIRHGHANSCDPLLPLTRDDLNISIGFYG